MVRDIEAGVGGVAELSDAFTRVQDTITPGRGSTLLTGGGRGHNIVNFHDV